MKKFFITLVLLMIVLLSVSFVPVKASTEHLDKINSYEIEINPLSDATLEMTYTISWTVLNDTLYGPLSWVKIGVCNRHVESIKNNTPETVSEVSYYSDSGSYIRVDFNHNYYKGETVVFSFSLIQKRIFTLNGDYVEFRFIPGWFNDIDVETCTIKWNKSIETLYTNSDSESDDYYIWERPLCAGESMNVDLRYSKDLFPNRNDKKQYIDSDKEGEIFGMCMFFGVVLVVIAIVIVTSRISIARSDGYTCYSGYTGRWMWYYNFYRPMSRGVDRHGKTAHAPVITNGGSGGHSSGGSSCACACACACAGGGRAGCSRKDFTDFREENDINKRR